ncbi:MAG: type III secretion inner membrane ring lipoprotein SctJ [Deltaproteobacteria bacterium]|jgi:type III secretion protein J|nr:type III secretion inner membrane ring lipoprotein SctJ [Deltaproteobacteria bacterium]
MKRLPRLSFFFIMGWLVFLAGCQTELYSGLSEEEANRMLVALLTRDIKAVKINQGKNGFSITVEETRTTMALELLNNEGLPSPKYQSLGQVFSGQGMISTPLEEQSRLAFALAEELGQTFAKIDGVLTSRAHVVLATHDQSGAVSSSASASIFLRHRPESPVVNLQAKIREICSKAVPGLTEDRVAIMLTPARDAVILPAVEKKSLSVWLIVAIGVLVVGGVSLGLKKAGYTLSRKPTNQNPSNAT